MHIRGLALFLSMLALSGVALGQDLPDRVNVGDGHMTVGFELKTTDRGSGPNGRTSAHSLMRYIIPKAGFGWSEGQRATVERWSSMSLTQRTAFFFEAYTGGYNSTNFVVDTAKYPHLDSRVSWYGNSLGIPHIELRSLPFDSPKKAFAAMSELKSNVRETIAFHMHMRFPDTGAPGANAENLTEWLRRASWSIWLRRADLSSKTSFVLKQADNQPVTPKELETLRSRLAGGQTGELLGRRGLRVQRLGGAGGPKIDVEIRGLMKDLPRMRQYLAATGEAFSRGSFGPLGYDRTPYVNDRGMDVAALSRTSTWRPGDLDGLERAFEEGMERYGVTSRLESESLGRALRRLATADTEGGKRTLLPSSFDWLFLPVEHDAGLPEGVQEQVEGKKRTYLERLVNLAERVHAGEFGEPGGQGYRPLSVASRTRRILHDFVNESYTDAGRRGKLFEWYETSLFEPVETQRRTQRWRNETGRNRSEGYLRRGRARAGVEAGLPTPGRAGAPAEGRFASAPERGFDRVGNRGVGGEVTRAAERPGSRLGVSEILRGRLDRTLDRSRATDRVRRGR